MPADSVQRPHTVSVFYDFAGPIDNVYASLIAWLVLAKDFGRLRLWQERAEFEVKGGGLCGLRKAARSGGCAHVEVYFDAKRRARDVTSSSVLSRTIWPKTAWNPRTPRGELLEGSCFRR